jgi:site-specific DNA-methyltransferase (cytosine-N4-specific)
MKTCRYWFDLDPIREGEPADGGRTWGERKAAGEPMRYGTAGQAAVGSGGFASDKPSNPGDVWTIATSPFAEAHFAVMAPALAERAILAGCKPGGTVLDPFSGSGTTGLVAGRLSAEYLDLSLRTRLAQSALIDGSAS